MQCLRWSSEPMQSALEVMERHQQQLVAASPEVASCDLVAHACMLGALADCLRAEKLHFMTALTAKASKAVSAAAEIGNCKATHSGRAAYSLILSSSISHPTPVS